MGGRLGSFLRGFKRGYKTYKGSPQDDPTEKKPFWMRLIFVLVFCGVGTALLILALLSMWSKV